jgi:hypothetical protein
MGTLVLCQATNQKGSWTMLRAMLLDRKCWQSAVMLDPDTGISRNSLNTRAHTLGLDPPGFKLRAATGFEAADFFVAGMAFAHLNEHSLTIALRILDLEQGTLAIRKCLDEIIENLAAIGIPANLDS